MESRFAKLMGYKERESYAPTFSSFILSDVTPQTIGFLREEAMRIKETDGDIVEADFFEEAATAFQDGKQVIFVPLVLPDQRITGLVLALIMPLRGRRPETDFKITTEEGIAYLDKIFPPIEGDAEESRARKEYVAHLGQNLEKGNRVVLSPARKLN